MVAYDNQHYRSNTVEHRARRPAHAQSRHDKTLPVTELVADSRVDVVISGYSIGWTALSPPTHCCQASRSQGKTFFR